MIRTMIDAIRRARFRLAAYRDLWVEGHSPPLCPRCIAGDQPGSSFAETRPQL
jgi:hypothetical protein